MSRNPKNKRQSSGDDTSHSVEIDDPELLDRMRTNRRAYAAAAGDVLDELRSSGFDINDIAELKRSGVDYKSAIPILIRWLPRVSYTPLKQDIVAALGVRGAGLQAARALIDEFTETDDDGLRWAVGDALATVADSSMFREIAPLVQDKTYGAARQMLAVSLGSMNEPQALDLLLGLLDDEELVGHAVKGLSKVGVQSIRSRLEPFTKHPKGWVRAEARKAIARIDKSAREKS